MELTNRQRVYAYWRFFRDGYNLYLSFPLGILNFTTIMYILLMERVPILYAIFPHYISFVISFLLVGIPLSTFCGWLHNKRTQAFATEQAINVEANPYNYQVIPGKEKDIFMPTFKVALTILRKQATEEEKQEIDKILNNIDKVKRGDKNGAKYRREDRPS